MSPGDASYAEPYFYVTVWPYPEKEKLPGLTVVISLINYRKWHTEGFIAVVVDRIRFNREWTERDSSRTSSSILSKRVPSWLFTACVRGVALLIQLSFILHA